MFINISIYTTVPCVFLQLYQAFPDDCLKQNPLEQQFRRKRTLCLISMVKT